MPIRFDGFYVSKQPVDFGMLERISLIVISDSTTTEL
jgi:hypothetical protein